jgi:hypothetical protein
MLKRERRESPEGRYVGNAADGIILYFKVI